jgi:hypothetical protein
VAAGHCIQKKGGANRDAKRWDDSHDNSSVWLAGVG